MSNESKPCAQCGTTFTTKVGGRQRFCTTECRAEAKRQASRTQVAQRRAEKDPQNCPQCGGLIEAAVTVGGPRMYCGDECARLVRRAREREVYRQTHGPRLAVSPDPCKWCGGEVPITEARGGIPKYCTPTCLREAQRQGMRNRRVEARAAVPETTTPCERCGTGIVHKAGDTRRRYCTDECHKETVKERKRAKAALLRGDVPPPSCRVCGGAFEVPATHVGQRPRYCSDECRKRRDRERQAERTKKRLVPTESAE